MKDILIGSFFSVGVYVCMCPHSCHMHGRLVGELNNPRRSVYYFDILKAYLGAINFS